MRRCLLLGLTAGIVTLFLASPALAQRDPFAEPGSGGSQSSGSSGEPQGNESDDGGIIIDPQPEPDTGGEQLANTGSEPAPFLVIAYGLVVAGAGAVFISRSWSTVHP